jgi:thiamine biosynthesis lipoprotein
MSSVQWRDWSCTVRVVLADGRDPHEAPASDTADRVHVVVRDLMRAVELSGSRFREDSDVSRVNARPGVLVPVRPMTVSLVELALSAASATSGACDPTVGLHVRAAGYDDDIDRVRRRDPAGVLPSLQVRRADWTEVRVDPELGRVGVPSGLALDLGATAKAWTADEAAARLVAATGYPALVALGGDLAVAGDGPSWPVLVSEHEGRPGQVVTVTSGGLATSSTAGRRWLTSAGEQHHLIDPATGRPARGPVRTASVQADSCLRANALATAAIVWGADAQERLTGSTSRLVLTDGTVLTTGAWTEDVAA